MARTTPSVETIYRRSTDATDEVKDVMRFTVAQKDFLRFCKIERRLSPHSLAAYHFDLADFCAWMSAKKDTNQVTETDLKLYLEDMVSTRSLSPATVRRRLACLRSFFRRMTDLGHANDPFARWRPQLPRRKRLPRALARSELITLIGEISSFDDGPTNRDWPAIVAFRLIIATGLRVGELCSLKIVDISSDCSVLRVHGKGSRDRIAYVADPKLKDALKRLIVFRRSQGSPSDGPLLVNRLGVPMKPQSIRTKLRRLASDAGMERRVTPHMLRHTAATLLIETGVDIRFVQRLLGHSSIATTEIYTHVTDEALRVTLERANVLGSLLIASAN